MTVGTISTQPLHAAADWHHRRRAAILARHPEVRAWLGPSPVTALVLVLLCGAHFAIAVSIAGAPWYAIVAAAYLGGAIVAHALGVLIHECAHNLVFRTTTANKVLAIVANLPLLMPAAIDFRYKHLLHHRHLGEGEHRDFQVPVARGARWVGGSPVRKLLWLTFASQMFPRGAVEGTPARRDRWELANIAANLVVTLAFAAVFGGRALLYLALSGLFAFGPHPLGVRGYGRHLVARGDQPTNSYYGLFNAVSFNVGYHVEHHDFPAVAWHRLPRLRRAASEFYSPLFVVRSWVALFVRFVFSRAADVDRYVSAEAFAAIDARVPRDVPRYDTPDTRRGRNPMARRRNEGSGEAPARRSVTPPPTTYRAAPRSSDSRE
jgi:sphingolipid 4-desaturase/C4-monooxygenase